MCSNLDTKICLRSNMGTPGKIWEPLISKNADRQMGNFIRFEFTVSFITSLLDMESLFYHYYSLFLIIFQYFIPVLIMTYSYVMVAFTIWRKRGNIDGQTSNSMTRSNTRELNLLNGRKRVSFYLLIACSILKFFQHSIIQSYHPNSQ